MPWSYPAIMLTAVATGIFLFRRDREPTSLSTREMLGLAFGAISGAMIGAKLPFVLADWPGFLSGAAWLDDGKTILSGLVGGYLGALAAEWALDIRNFNCDRFAVPVAAAVGIGRLACYSAGCCFGTPTGLCWGVDFGDGLLRHPTQLYESAFHLSAAVVLWHLRRRNLLAGHLVRLYFVAYFGYRFATEFIRPEPRLWLGLTGYQWATLVLAPFFGLWCCPGCRPWRILWGFGAERRASPPAKRLDDTQLVTTGTLCPKCLRPLPGTVFQESGRVLLRRECPEHGTIDALVSSARRHYWLRHEAPHPPPAEGCCCGVGPPHKTCIALLEITGACNLHCPVCFAQSPRGGHRSADELLADVEALLAARGPLEVLQLSGGEPLLHPELFEILDRSKRLPIDAVVINTNGLALAEDDRLAAGLARRMPRLEIALQMDGLDARTHRILRGADLLAAKHAALGRLVAHGLPTTLVATIVRGVNEDQLGGLVRLGLDTPVVRGVTLQAATWSGRYGLEADPMDRVTAGDVIRLLVEQGDGRLAEDDFKPLPCGHPNCCSFTFLTRRGPRAPLTRIVRYEDHLDQLSDRIRFDLADARRCCGPDWRREDFLRIVVKPFMDAYTYDEQRVRECCIHVIRPGGTAVSFCRFNALERQRAPEPPAYLDGQDRQFCRVGRAERAPP